MFFRFYPVQMLQGLRAVYIFDPIGLFSIKSSVEKPGRYFERPYIPTMWRPVTASLPLGLKIVYRNIIGNIRDVQFDVGEVTIWE
jgi:hypothetical protein